jgi:hypothetical protein
MGDGRLFGSEADGTAKFYNAAHAIPELFHLDEIA